MKGTWVRRAVVPVAFAVMVAGSLTAQQRQTNPTAVQQTARSVEREIVVSLEDRKLALIENGEVKKIYTVAVGKPSTPSPEGTFRIERRVANPTYQHAGQTVLPGPNNPVGSRWMGLSKTGYGIHGTNQPKSIGKAASHGCIRMGRADLEEFYAMVAVGDTVRLIGHRDAETARLFEPAQIAAQAPAVETASTEALPAAAPDSESVRAIAAPTAGLAAAGEQ